MASTPNFIFGYIPSKNIERSTKNKPEERQNRIIKKLKEKFDINSCMELTYDYNPDHEEKFIQLLSIIHDPDYIIYLIKAYEEYVKSRYDKGFTLEQNNDKGLIPECFIKTQIEEFKKKIPIWKQGCLFATDAFTPIFDHTLQTVLDSAYCAHYLAKYIITNNKSIGYAITTNPGHHAGRDFYGGFCFVNNAVVAAYTFLEKYDTVCILDLDVHAGDGTNDCVRYFNRNIFKPDNKKLVSISIHMNPVYEYPHCRGFPQQDDETNGVHNLLIEPDCNIMQYNKALDEAIYFMNSFDNDKPIDALIIAFGGDTYYEDPEVVGKCGLHLEDYLAVGKKISSFLKSKNMKILITQEGGYAIDQIANIVDNFITGLID